MLSFVMKLLFKHITDFDHPHPPLPLLPANHLWLILSFTKLFTPSIFMLLVFVWKVYAPHVRENVGFVDTSQAA